MSKKNFIIWSYLDGPIRVEKTNTLLKNYTNRCEGSLREPSQSQRDWLRQHSSQTVRFANRDCFVASLLAMTVVAIVIANLPLRGVAISNLSVIARLPEGKPWQSRKEKIGF